MKNYRRNNYIGKMKKGFKQKLSLLMIACLLFTGYRGLTISGRADSSHTEQNNEIEVSGSQVKVQLLGADLRRAATEAILKGEKVGKSNLRSYSKDQELATEFEEYFDGEKEIYNIPLNSIAENLEESLNAEEAGLQIYVERDAKDLDRLVRKESKESLLLYSKESAVAGLLPKKEEATTVSLTEEKASDSNLERNTELTGSELITFVYENKSTERMTFQLSVDGNKYPKVTVASKTSLFKQFLGDAKKAQAEAKNAKATEAKVESTEAQTVEASKAEESSAEAKQEVVESKATEATKATEESKASEEARKDDSEVAIVSTAAEAVAESTEAKAEVKTEASEEATEARVEATEAEVKEAAAKAETAQAEKATEAQKAVVEDSSLLKDITEHSEEILPELQSIRFTQYSLNELGRKSQNVEIEGFGNVQVFYDEAAFDGDVVLEAKRLFKPEEEAEGEKLSEEQVKVLKEHSIYDDAASLDIRFVDKKDSTTEVEPKSPVSVRISIDKKALPETVSSDSISIHHLVENDKTKEVEKVEVVVQPSILKSKDVLDSEEASGTLKTEEDKNDTITKEFVVDSFSLYQINWTDSAVAYCPPIIFHYVDKNFNEIGPTVRKEYHYKTGLEQYIKKRDKNDSSTWQIEVPGDAKGNLNIFDKENKLAKTPENAYKTFRGYDFVAVYPYRPGLDNLDKIVNGGTNDYFDLNYKYNGHEMKDFSSGISKIDNLGYTLNGQRYVWYTLAYGKNHYNKNCATEFYFVYDTTTKETKKRTEEEIETKQDKYIKDNQDGTYDLTLSAQVKKKTKPENLDIVFLVDTSKTMNMSFGTRNNIIGDIPADKLAPAGTSRKELVQEYLSQMVTSLSKNSNYNLRFGLVGFGGSKTDNGATISDTAFNDVTYVGGYTSSASEFNNMLANLPESEGGQTGPNYTAAIMGARRLIDDSFIGNFDGADHVTSSSVGHDTNKIIVLISDNDPVYSYVLEDGVYDETRKTSGGLSDFTASLKNGYSYGNGVDFSRVALNQARGFLSMYNDNAYTAFYTIGIGNKDNWKHLKELTQAHGPSEFTGDDHRRWEDVPFTNSGKFIRAKSTLLKGADSKIFDGSTPDSLKSSIIELGQKIAPNATELTITDTLSENVTLVKDTELKAEVFKMDANGVDTVGEALTEPQLKELGLKRFILEKPNPALQQGGEIKLTTDPSDFSLPAGYEIRLTATIKPSAKAYEKLSKSQATTDRGGDRTDLQDIYRKEKITLPSDYSNAAKYGTSAGKYGLFTNSEAHFSYKWKGKTPKTPYNNPIIKVQNRDLTIEKQIVGLDGNGYITSDNKSKSKGDSVASGFTKLGIDILKDIKFTVYEIQNDGTEKEYVSFKLYQDGSNEDQSKEGIIKVGDITVKRNQVKYIKEYDRLSLGYTITGLDPSKKYKVKETVSGKSYQYTNVSENFAHLQYKFKESANDSNEEAFKLADGKVVTIKNTYEKENPKKKVVVQKEVKEMGLPAFTQAEQEREFDFYLALKDDAGRQLTEEQLTTIRNGFDEQLKSKISITTIQDIQKGSTKQISVFHFKLRHNTQIEIPLDVNTQYNVIEKKEDDYNAAEILTKKGEDGEEVSCDVITRNGVQFTCTGYLTKPKEFTKFVNPKKLPIPTGVVRDITPYIFGIFGFVAMAGAYLAINKKRREV
ncbi:DUF7604 domain-containing protein [Oribacterium sinus]|uniref:DUF7604 domain-containing protein n=1 Tax=Oribacterium sinus TaxID=237576 RepID=UPI0028D6A729|nr:hypothetical protein [Oribacterium sinus]